MKIKTNKSKNKYLIAIPLVILACALPILWYTNTQRTNDPSQDSPDITSKPTTEQIEAGDRSKEESTNNNDATPIEKSPTELLEKTRIDSYITALNQTDSELQIRTNINALISSGSCKVQLSQPAQQTVTEVAGVTTLASTSTCKGFNIPLSKLAKGKWSITLTVSSNSYESVANDVVEVK